MRLFHDSGQWESITFKFYRLVGHRASTTRGARAGNVTKGQFTNWRAVGEAITNVQAVTRLFPSLHSSVVLQYGDVGAPRTPRLNTF
jgi:hypothetical protein